MLSEVGKVVAVEEDGLWVETHQQSACSQCRAKHGCGQKLLAGGPSEQTLVKALFNAQSPNCIWTVGDAVQIGIEERALVTGAFIAYFLPLVAMVLLVLVGVGFSVSDKVLPFFAIAGLILGGCFVKLHSTKQREVIAGGGASCYQAIVLGRSLNS